MNRIRRWLVRLYLAEGRGWARMVRVLDGVHAGFWLGVLSRPTLQMVDEAHYRTHSTYNGEQHNLRGLMDWEEAAIPFFEGRRRLLVLAAGGGREVLALERRGHQVDGYECNPALVAFAGSFLPRHGCTGVVAPLARDAVPEGGPYDGVIVGWGGYMLTAGRARRVRMLREIRARMPEGSPLLLSFFTRPEYLTRAYVAYRVARPLRWLLRREPPDEGDDVIPFFVHRFTQREIEAEMRDGGFALARFVPEGRGQNDSGWAVGHAVRADAPSAAALAPPSAAADRIPP